MVALKEYRPPPGASPAWPRDGTWRQIEHQAWLLRGLPRTDHLVRVRDEFLGATSGPGLGGDPRSPHKAFDTPFVVMEWIEGARPDVLLQADRATLSQRLGWVQDLAEAVDLLHSVSRTGRFPLVHGDIKPGNCLITPRRGLVLVDTGALQVADGIGEFRGLRSPPYAAPEVLAGPGRRRGTATDLYSLGAVAFFLLTSNPPPNGEYADYLVLAHAELMRCADIERGRRPLVAAHLLRLLDTDPAQRSRTSAVQWARELIELVQHPSPSAVIGSRPRRSRRIAALAGGVTTLVAGAAVASTLMAGPSAMPPSEAAGSQAGNPTGVGPTPSLLPGGTTTSSTAPGTSWPRKAFADLPAFTAGGGPLLYEQTFTAPSSDWPEVAQAGYETRYRDGGYDAHILDHGVHQPIPGPDTASSTDQVVSATASVQSGQGGWGVWCRGSDNEGSERYAFLLSHAGAVQIVGPDGGGTGWVYIDGLDVAGPTTLSARCADVADGPVELTLAVDGRTALSYKPPTTALLGPGYAGLEEMSFSEVNGPTITARYDHFDIRRAVR